MKFPCPFVYADGQPCGGHIARIEAYKADLEWTCREDGDWTFRFGRPRSHFHLYCSEKGDHSGQLRPSDPRMKFYADELPLDLQDILFGDYAAGGR